MNIDIHIDRCTSVLSSGDTVDQQIYNHAVQIYIEHKIKSVQILSVVVISL